MAKKPEGRFLAKEGSSPQRYKPKGGLWSGWKPACLYGTSRGQASSYTALILVLMGKNWGFPGKAISMLAPENMDCFSDNLVFPAVLFVIQFSSVFPDYSLIILIFHSYFPVVIWDLTKLQ